MVKAIEYDAYGNVIGDSNPGFEIPFGFAGGDTNLYGYVLGDPVKYLAPTTRNPLLSEGEQGRFPVLVEALLEMW